jgi:hypothetical protein
MKTLDDVVFQPVRVATHSDDGEGLLVLVNSELVAVLVRLSEHHPDRAGEWFLEHGFGRLDGPEHAVFADLDAARAWIVQKLSRP